MGHSRKPTGAPSSTGGQFDQRVRTPAATNLETGGEELLWPATTYGNVWFEPTDEYANAYGELPPPGFYTPNETPLIAKQRFTLSNDLAALAAEATQNAQAFDNEYGEIVAPFASIIMRSEAAASSEIEHLSASAKAILQAELGDDSKANAVQIAANVRAMQTALGNSDGVSVVEILAIHKSLLCDDPKLGATAGQLRRDPVWIGGDRRYRSPVGAAMAGVVPEKLHESLEDLSAFAARKDIPALIKAAITHAQFENIHPFEDGNGRTGRAIITSMLRQDGVMKNITVPISAAILSKSSEYYSALTSFKAGDAAPIVRVFAQATESSVKNGRLLGDDIVSLREKWRQQIQARADSSIWSITDYFLGSPVATAESIQAALGISMKSAYAAAEKLEAAGVLTSSKHRGVLQWRSVEMLEALDRFGRRAGFRS